MSTAEAQLSLLSKMTGVRNVGAEKITDKILSDAKSRADKIISAAESEAKSVCLQSDKTVEAMKSECMKRAGAEAELAKKRIIASAHMEAKKLLLETKQKLLSEAFDMALEKIRAMSDADFKAFMTKLMTGMIETGNETVIINKDDKKRLGEDFLDGVNKAVSKDKPCKVTESEEKREIGSGFILKRGDIEINATFDALLRQQKDSLSAEIIKILF